MKMAQMLSEEMQQHTSNFRTNNIVASYSSTASQLLDC
jgi:hypothetical protein